MATFWEKTKQIASDISDLSQVSTNDFVDVLQETSPAIMDKVLALDPDLDKDQRGEIFMNHLVKDPAFRQNVLDAKAAQPEAFQDLMETLGLDVDQVNKRVDLLDNSIVNNALNNHPDAMKAVLSSGDTQSLMADAGVRHTLVDSVLADPSALNGLKGAFPDLANNPQMAQVAKFLENPAALRIARANPELAYQMADPANAGEMGKVFQTQLEKYSFRSSIVEAAISDPQAMKELIRDVPELSQNPQVKEMLPMLDNKFNMHVASQNPNMLNDMLDPASDNQQVQAFYMNKSEVQASVAEGVHLYREDAIKYQNSLDVPNPELQQLIDLDPAVLAQSMSAIKAGANAQQTITQNAVNAEFDPIITLSKTDPEAAGQAFVDKMGEKIGGNSAAVQANMAELKANPELMKAIGDDLAKNGAELKRSLPKLVGGDPQAGAQFMSKHPAMAQAAVPLMAANNPAQAAGMAMDSLRDNLTRSISGVDSAIAKASKGGATEAEIAHDIDLLQKADSAADLKGIKHIDISKLDQKELLGSISEVNGVVDGLEGKQAFMNGLGSRLADPAQAANLMENLESSGSGDLTSLKVVAKSLKDDPEGGLDILASEHFMVLATERWGTDIANAKIDGFFADMETAMADFAKSDMGMMLKDQFGIDLGQMAGGLGGFADMIKQQITPMISNMGADMANLQVGGGIVAAINGRLEPYGESIGMNSVGGDLSGIVSGAQSHLANTQQYAANVQYAKEMGLSGQELKNYIDDQVQDRFERELPIKKVVDASTGQVRERTPTELASAQKIEDNHNQQLADSRLPGNEPSVDLVSGG